MTNEAPLAGKVLRISETAPRGWGADCLSWDMVDRPDLLVATESMPHGTSETRHLHDRARQVFLVLEGELEIEAAGSHVVLRPREAFEVPPGVPHQVFNRSGRPVEFLAISTPSTKGDRNAAPAPVRPLGGN